MSGYSVYATPQAAREAKNLPGHVRQRIKRAIDDLADAPLPARSKALDLPDCDVEIRRLRIDKWRVLYAVQDREQVVDVFAIRQRPPYDYGDLHELIKGVV